MVLGLILSAAKADLVEAPAHKLEALPGNNYEFTQPIEMHFNELISGCARSWHPTFMATI